MGRQRFTFDATTVCCWFLAGTCNLLLGCGESTPPTYPVSGQVVYQDGTPLPMGGRVRFHCTDVTPPLTADGRIDKDGRVESLTTFRAGDGVVAGKHEAVVMPDIPDDKGNMSEAEYQKASDPMDRRFKGFKTSGLTLTVSPDQVNEFKFEIQKPRRRR